MKTSKPVLLAQLLALMLALGCITTTPSRETTTTTVPAPKGGEGGFCGGIAGIACDEGLTCRLDGNYPDAGGVCVKAECSEDSDCSRGGCSGQVCTTREKSGNIVTTCEMRPEYECLKLTSCGCANGRCMFKTTPEFMSCWESKKTAKPAKLL